MAYAKVNQNEQDKNIGGGGGMTGNAAGGAAGINQGQSAAGTPGGFTNIQDYMNANKGDMTNQNYLNTKADAQIGNAAQQMNSNVANLSAINQNPAASQQALTNMLRTNDYSTLGKYATNPNFTPTSTELPDIANPTANLKGDLSGVMSYIGEIKPQSQQYTPGMQKFDEMLLSGDKAFPQQFAENKKAQYKTQVEDPYGATKAAREGQKTQATEGAGKWRNEMKTYLGGQDKAIQDILKKQQAQEADTSNLTYDEFKQMYAPKVEQAISSGNMAEIPGLPTAPYKDYSEAVMSPEQYRNYVNSVLTPENYSNYAQRSQFTTPNTGTAVTEYGTDNTADYNALSSIIGGQQILPTGTYNPGAWNLKGLPFA